MDHIEKFYMYLQDLDQSYTHLIDLLRQKMSAVSARDMDKLDKIMKDEQAYVLMARGFDQNLQTHRKNLDLRGDTLSEVIDELPEEQRGRFWELYKQLRATLDQVKILNQKCQTLIEDRLYTLDRSIKAIDKSDNSTYHKEGGAAAGKPSAGFFSKSV